MTCGCCDGVHTVTPTPVYNRPGLPALSYRAGTHGRFRESMLARLSSKPALAGLTTREPDDPAIALLDCWALVGDVLTFYQERIANEGYLRTATEQESLTQLGRLVGYTPRPPLGSSTYLAYTLDPGAKSFIPVGSGAKSVPEQGQLPQTYETSEDLVAREEWNALAVARTNPPNISADNVDEKLARFDVEGTAANLKPGDRLLFQFGATSGAHVRVVKVSTPDFQTNRTSVTLVSAGTELDEFATARDVLAAALRNAGAAAVTTRNRFARGIDREHLRPLRDALAANPSPNPDEVLGPQGSWGVIEWHLRRLPEEEAIARPHADSALNTWFDGLFKAVRENGATLIALATRLARRSHPEVEELRALARFLVCGPEWDECPPPPPCEDPLQATGLVGLTPILPALRRDPSRPPRNARALNAKVAQLFRPDSDVHPRLLIAADPRLGPNLHSAWAKQEIAPPLPLSSLQVMRIKASVAAPLATSGDETSYQLLLDAVYDAILPGTPVIFSEGAKLKVLRPDRVTHGQLALTIPDPAHAGQDRPAGTMTVTVLEFNDRPDISETAIKGTPLWAQGAEITPLGDPITEDVAGNSIELARNYPGLRPGRWVIVSGERTDVPYTSGVQASELAMVAGISQRVEADRPGAPVRTTLRLANTLAYTYRRSAVTIYGNVVAATAGETRHEVLGSGDSGKANQAFRLRQVLEQTPLTWSAADNPLGAEDSLTTRVTGVAWHETDGLVWSGPTEHSFVLRTGTDGSVSVGFGDGVHGARLPSGTENVTARYRTGAGRSGNVAAGKITQLAARPLGVGAVTNPLHATGGVDGDGPGDARVTTPLRMQALDRLVSVRDYQDFTRARAGIGKASAVKLFDGSSEVVHVTIAGIGDVPIDPLSRLFATLEAALVDFGDLGVPVRVAVRDLQLLVLNAGIKVLPDYSWDLVEPAVRTTLLTEFGFVARQLGEPAYLSRAIAAIQRVEGVDYADVDVFQAIRGDVTPVQLATIVAGLNGAMTCIPSSAAHYEERKHDVANRDTLTSIAQRYGLTLDELARWNPGLSGSGLSTVDKLVVFRGIRPAQLAVLPADVPETLTLRRIP